MTPKHATIVDVPELHSPLVIAPLLHHESRYDMLHAFKLFIRKGPNEPAPRKLRIFPRGGIVELLDMLLGPWWWPA